MNKNITCLFCLVCLIANSALAMEAKKNEVETKVGVVTMGHKELMATRDAVRAKIFKTQKTITKFEKKMAKLMPEEAENNEFLEQALEKMGSNMVELEEKAMMYMGMHSKFEKKLAKLRKTLAKHEKKLTKTKAKMNQFKIQKTQRLAKKAERMAKKDETAKEKKGDN